MSFNSISQNFGVSEKLSVGTIGSTLKENTAIDYNNNIPQPLGPYTANAVIKLSVS